jgi:hypothetical protein
VYITSTLAAMTRIWYGELPVQKAIDRDEMKVVAPPVYARNISRWLRISAFTTDNPSLGRGYSDF